MVNDEDVGGCKTVRFGTNKKVDYIGSEKGVVSPSSAISLSHEKDMLCRTEGELFWALSFEICSTFHNCQGARISPDVGVRVPVKTC